MSTEAAEPGIKFELEGNVLWTRLNRPKLGNSLDPWCMQALVEQFTAADSNPDVRAIAIIGSGKNFCTGADVRPPTDSGMTEDVAAKPQSPIDYRKGLPPVQNLFRVMWELETPIIVGVNGNVMGIGNLLALCGDLVLASSGARWRQWFTTIGMMPHGGDIYFMPRIVGLQRALQMALLDEPMSSQQLHDWGVIYKVVEPDELEHEVRETAERVARGATRAIGQARRLYRRSIDVDITTAFNAELDAIGLVATTNDRFEGVQAARERRPPNFTGS
jgi:2-(1,2-epoxy-1,2-dihydrophenyl)acetyl-CoA isomerase